MRVLPEAGTTISRASSIEHHANGCMTLASISSDRVSLSIQQQVEAELAPIVNLRLLNG
jgi:hypothetical protein